MYLFIRLPFRPTPIPPTRQRAARRSWPARPSAPAETEAAPRSGSKPDTYACMNM